MPQLGIYWQFYTNSNGHTQLPLISEIIAFAKGGADNTNNISVWSICIDIQ